MKRKELGFTLIELMIVVAIVAILSAIALPAYRQYVVKSTRAMGAAELLKVVNRQEQYFINNKAYATDLSNLGYPANPYYIDSQGQAQSSATDSIYKLSAAGAFTISAEPQNGQADDTDCGTLTINQFGVKGESGSLDVSDCWR